MADDVAVYIVDMQKDFEEGGSLAVDGGLSAGEKIAAMYRRAGRRINTTYASVDTHPYLHWSHPTMWRDSAGNMPAPFTVITAEDVRARRWTPRNPNARPSALRGKTIRDYAIAYLEALEAKGNHKHTIWPLHCVLGTEGHAMDPTLMVALNEWCDQQFQAIHWNAKGACVWTEQYGGFWAEVPLPTDPTTGTRTELLKGIQNHKKFALVGLAGNFCVLETLRQLGEVASDAFMRRVHLLTDASPCIDLPEPMERYNRLLEDFVQRGLNLSTTEEFLA